MFEKLMKIVIALPILCMICLLAFPQKAYASENMKDADGIWEFKERSGKDEAEILKYHGEGGDVKIPETLGGYTVTRIGDEAFYECGKLTSITIPDKVTSIGANTFSGCTSLKNVSFGTGVEGLWRGAFAGCTSLAEISIPDSVTNIDPSTFSGCKNLGVISLGQGMLESTELNSAMKTWFSNASSSYKVKIRDGVTKIHRFFFKDCSGLTAVEFSDSVTTIENSAFVYCSSLTSVKFSDSVTTIEDGAFEYCSALTEIAIPQNVTKLGRQVFSNCEKLSRVTIKNNCIGPQMFQNCKNLTSVTILGNVETIGEIAFDCCVNLTEVRLPAGLKSIERYAFSHCPKLVKITLPDSLVRLGEGVFYEAGLTSIKIPKRVSDIGTRAIGFNSYHDESSKGSQAQKGFIIYGYRNTAAQRYAQKNKITFKALDGLADTARDISGAKLSAIPDKAYTGKSVKPSLTVKYNGKKLTSKNYTLVYKNNVKIGTATVTVKGRGDYTGSVSKKFKIVPAKATIRKLNAGKKNLTVQIKKQSGGVTYQIQYKPKGSEAAYKSVYAKTPKAVIKKLDSKKTYAVRVRAYKKIGKKIYNGRFSAVKYQTIK